ncbi:MAG: RluA family pseudouridine synthase [Lachnospiraceae bacterium]|nr:RluA family pseudouridine synthase [Lachnospiraceae bacterium]
MREIKVTKGMEGQRMERVLMRYLPKASKGFLYKMLRKKNIKLNGAKAAGNEKLSAGDLIAIYFSDETIQKFQGDEGDLGARALGSKTEDISSNTPSRRRSVPAKKSPLRDQVKILYQDDEIMALHKPAGLLSQRAHVEDDSLNDVLLDLLMDQGLVTRESLTLFRPSIANRLDRNTSGIVLCGLTTRGLQKLSKLLRDREAEKYYLCLAAGRIERDQHIRGYLLKDEKKNQVSISKTKQAGASYIETEYQVLSRGRDASLLKVHLITGKSHQIRAHLASVGHPVLGDYKYGDRRRNDAIKRRNQVSFQLLHSYEFIAKDPEDPEGERLHVMDPLPEVFHQVMKDLGVAMPREIN